jgi:hypothetical protein
VPQRTALPAACPVSVIVTVAFICWYCQLLSPTHCQLRTTSRHSCSRNVQTAWRKVLWFSSVSPARAVTCLNWARPVAVCYALVIVVSGTARSGQLEMTLNERRTEREPLDTTLTFSVSFALSHSRTRHSPLATRPHCPLRPLSHALTHITLMDVLILFISWKINVTAPGRDGRWIEDPGCPPGVSGLYCFSCVI